TDTTPTTTLATSGGAILQGEMHSSARRKSARMGQTTSVVRDGDAMKSLITSNERRFDANAPTDSGFSSRRIFSTRSMIRADRLISTRLLAASTTLARNAVRIKLKTSTNEMPATRTHSVSTALFGTTRSYTFIVKRGMDNANALINTAAN